MNRKPILPAVVVTIVAVAVGLVPALVRFGFRLPDQSAWRSDAAVSEPPFALLPLSQYNVVLLIAMLGMPFAIAGFARLIPWVAATSRRVTCLLVLAIEIAVVAQSFAALSPVVAERPGSGLYLGLLGVVCVIGLVIGVLTFWLVTTGERPAILIGVTLTVLGFVWWFSAIAPAAGSALRWLPAIATGFAIAWCGFVTRARIAAAVGALALVVLIPAASTAVQSAVGANALFTDPGEVFQYAGEVFLSYLTRPELTLFPALVVLLASMLGVFFLRMAPGSDVDAR